MTAIIWKRGKMVVSVRIVMWGISSAMINSSQSSIHPKQIEMWAPDWRVVACPHNVRVKIVITCNDNYISFPETLDLPCFLFRAAVFSHRGSLFSARSVMCGLC